MYRIALFFVTFCLFITIGSFLTIPKKNVVNVYNKVNQLTSYSPIWDLQKQLSDFHITLQDHQQPPSHPDSLTESIPVSTSSSSSKLVGSLLLVQHKPVYTFGSATEDNSGPFTQLDKHGNPLEYETVKIDRGGQATYHGPGQLVAYPIIDLNYFQTDIHGYLRKLELSIIDLFDKYQIKATTIPGLTGVWVNDQKLAAIGIKISRWVTMHGICINISPDMRYFENIIPCGITDKTVGRMIDHNPLVSIDQIAIDYANSFAKIFDIELNYQNI